jgi:predicted nucleotidyltransferase
MRLKPAEIAFIKATVAEHFGADARVRLFGSRVDDAKRGGDVDLYVEPVERSELYMRRVRCMGRLEDGLLYPVDLVVAEPDAPRAIDHIALADGVVL